MFTFQEAVAELQRTHPNTPLGLTVQQGQYYERAQNMTFQQLAADTFEARENPNMWVYVGPKGLICCGDKVT